MKLKQRYQTFYPSQNAQLDSWIPAHMHHQQHVLHTRYGTKSSRESRSQENDEQSKLHCVPKKTCDNVFDDNLN